MTMPVSSQALKWLKWSVLWLGLGLLFPKILPAENTAFSLRPQDLIIEQQPRATTSARRSHLQEQQERIAPERFDLQRYPVTEANETQWRQTPVSHRDRGDLPDPRTAPESELIAFPSKDGTNGDAGGNPTLSQ
jgi:hypothetical protein